MDATVKLSIEQWNVALDILSDGSVKKAMPLINAIMEQIHRQTQMEQQTANGPRQDHKALPDDDPE